MNPFLKEDEIYYICKKIRNSIVSKINFPDNPLKSSRISINLKDISLSKVNTILNKLIYIRR